MAYGTDSGLTDYASARGVTLEQSTDVLLTLAHDWIESQDFIGNKTDDGQAKQWPRKNAVVDGAKLDPTEVPEGIVEAEYQTAIAIDQGNSPFATVEPAVKRESVDTISVEFQDGAGTRSFDPMVRLKLRKFLRSGGASTNIVNVGRA